MHGSHTIGHDRDSGLEGRGRAVSPHRQHIAVEGDGVGGESPRGPGPPSVRSRGGQGLGVWWCVCVYNMDARVHVCVCTAWMRTCMCVCVYSMDACMCVWHVCVCVWGGGQGTENKEAFAAARRVQNHLSATAGAQEPTGARWQQGKQVRTGR